MEFITKEEVSILENKDPRTVTALMNEVLTRVYNKAKEDSINKAVEESMKLTPDLMLRLFVSQQSRTKMVTDFYNEHPEFKEHKDIVVAVIAEIDYNNPDKDYGELMKLAEPIIKEKIKNIKNSEQLSIDNKTGSFNPNGNGAL